MRAEMTLVQASFHWLQESFQVAEALPGSAVAA